MSDAVCRCGSLLSPNEQHYYIDRCEECERAWSARMTAWRMGAPDAELDKAFAEPRTLQ